MTVDQIKKTIQAGIRSGKSLFLPNAKVTHMGHPSKDGIGKVQILAVDQEGKKPSRHNGTYTITEDLGIRVSFSWQSKRTFLCPFLTEQTETEGESQ